MNPAPSITDILALLAIPACAVLGAYGLVLIYRAHRAKKHAKHIHIWKA